MIQPFFRSRFFILPLMLFPLLLGAITPDEKKNGKDQNGLGAKVERLFLKVFSKELVEKAKGLLNVPSLVKLSDWLKRHPGCGILGISTTCACVFRKQFLPFTLSLAGMGVGAIVFLGNGEYVGTPIEGAIRTVQQFFKNMSHEPHDGTQK